MSGPPPSEDPTPDLVAGDRAVVVGLGVTGQAVTRALVERGVVAVAVEDRPQDAHRTFARAVGVDLVEAPDAHALAEVVTSAAVVLPSPGVPDRHPVFSTARAEAVPIQSEFDLARQWDDRPVVAVTGTNGKTTVTELTVEMLLADGRRAVVAGNTDVPLVEAIDDEAADVFVVEASSFRLGHTERWAPRAAAWLNFAPDHLDVHADLESYEAAKAAIWRDQAADDVAVVNLDDDTVASHAGPARRVTFSIDGPADYRVEGDRLVGPGGEVLAEVAQLWRDLRHDQANALAASALAHAAGAGTDAVHTALASFTGLPHRVSLVADVDGVRWYDDSKATTPHATAAAVESFGSVVLIAGGHNKGISLAPLAEQAHRYRRVVAIGEASGAVVEAIGGAVPTAQADSMDEAVRLAAAAAVAGDVVLLSPGCASFDWYSSYAERGDDFARATRHHLGVAS